ALDESDDTGSKDEREGALETHGGDEFTAFGMSRGYEQGKEAKDGGATYGSQPNDDRAARRRGRCVGGHGRSDAGHGRGPGNQPRWARVVPRNLGDDDRGDDAAFGGA